MDTRFLETLIAVAERGSFTEAARRLNLTPTAVAQRIRALEAEFGAPLVSRSGRQVSPTGAGRAVLAGAEAFLMHFRALKGVALAGRMAGELRVGVISTALTGLMPDVVGRLADAHGGIDLFLEPGVSAGLYDAVVAGRLDAAVIVRPPFDLPKTTEFEIWRREPMILVAPRNETRRNAADILRDRPLIRYDRGQWGGRLASEALTALGVTPRERFELDAPDAILTLVARGLGASIIPDSAAPHPQGVRVRKIPLPGPALVREVGLLWMRDTPRPHLIAALRKMATG